MIQSDIRSIFLAGVKAVDPYERVFHECQRLDPDGRYTLIAFGKAAYRMAEAAHDALREKIERGVVITKHGHAGGPIKGLEIYEAGHPTPDEHGVRATSRAIDVIKKASPESTLLALISGGGSALLCKPMDGISLRDKQSLTEDLIKSGASINEINAVRKHVSAVKGGRLAALAAPRKTVALIVSDVIGDPLDVIASGPFAPDTSTFKDALSVISRFGIKAPALKHLEAGLAGHTPETPKPGDLIFDLVDNRIIANNSIALAAAAKEARRLGYTPTILTDRLSGDVQDIARLLVSNARMMPGNTCLIAGGEPTVRVTGDGLGGRNTELALIMAELIDGLPLTALSAGTDGTDGPTDAAGAMADGDTIKRATALGLDAGLSLRDNDSYTFFKGLGGLVTTGPTGTNVMDVVIILSRQPGR